MPLPQPTFLPYRPNEFVSAEPTVSRGMELFAKYHPAQMQQAMYQQLLEEYERRDLNAQEQAKLLAQERTQILKNLNNFRESGLGPSGRAGGVDAALRGGRGGIGAGSNDLVDMTNAAANLQRGYTDRKIAGAELTFEQQRRVDDLYEPRDQENNIIRSILQDARRKSGGTQLLEKATLSGVLESAMGEYFTRVDPQGLSPQGRRAAAARLYEQVRALYPGAMDPRNAQLIDELFGTDGFVLGNMNDPRSLNEIVRLEKQADKKQMEFGFGEEGFERRLASEMEAAEIGGATVDELAAIRERGEARRQMLGYQAPLTTEEQAFLQTYVNALRDDGVATVEEFGSAEEFQQAKAAYEKGRLIETLPRGTAAFYDESYLRGLGRLGEIEGQMAELQGRPSPGQEAARRTLGLPQVSAEDYMAAAQVSPLAAEALPYTIKRFNDAAGDIQPRDRVERTAMQLITAGDRNFPAFAQQINKLYDNPADRQKAIALYGAYYMAQDARGSTLNPGTLAGDPAEAARAAAQQASLVTPARQFTAEAAPTPLPTPAPLPTSTMGREQVRQYVETLRPEGGSTYVDEFGSPISIEGMAMEAARGNLSPYMTVEDYFAQQAGLP